MINPLAPWCLVKVREMAQQTCCIADSEQVYQVQIAGAPTPPILIDSSPLANRAALLIWNEGPNLVRVYPNNAAMIFSQGFPIAANAGIILSVGPGVKHYGACAAGLTSQVTVIEVGVTQ
jgi:hypothetical protein